MPRVGSSLVRHGLRRIRHRPLLRHTTAMTLVQSEVSTSVFGHEQESTTRGYLHDGASSNDRPHRIAKHPPRALPRQRQSARVPRNAMNQRSSR